MYWIATTNIISADLFSLYVMCKLTVSVSHTKQEP